MNAQKRRILLQKNAGETLNISFIRVELRN